MSFNCKKLVCVLLALITVIAMTSVVAFAEEESVPAQEVSETESSVAENADTIFEIIGRGEGTLMERLVHGGKVTLVGMIVVFAVLIVLMVILYLFQLIFARKSRKAPEEPVKKVSAPAPAAAPVAAPAAANNEDELVAVATAAIAAARGESDCAFDVISITKVN